MIRKRLNFRAGTGLALALSMAACANDDASGPEQPADAPDSALAAVPADPTPTSRQAVQDTIAQNAVCQGIKPFYWEIGYAGDRTIGGSVGLGYGRNSSMEIASSSKWLYTAYYVQKTGGHVDANKDVPFLTFTSGYDSIANSACIGRTVHGCNQYTQNTAPGTADHPGADTSAVGRFDYNSGHLEAHADNAGALGGNTASTLGNALRTQLGSDITLSYDNPLLAGGGRSTPASYALFLQKILRGTLTIRGLLGSNATCTLSPDYASLFGERCNAVFSPWWPAMSGTLADTPDPSLVQDVHYSLGHWVEPDGAFSSPGLFGFYPWIDASKTWYGVIARRQVFQVFDEAHPDTSAYAQSVQCGQAVRAAWLDGTVHR